MVVDAVRRAQADAPGRAGVSALAQLIVTGNPNVGKSVVFHALTGRYVTVSNYPGTTVMGSTGTAWIDGRQVTVHDTPGLNSLCAASEDELVGRDLLLGGQAIVLQVADAKNLLRALTLTLELAEAGLPVVLQLNMIDEARERRMRIDAELLSRLLSIPVVPTIATQGWGIDQLRRAIPNAARAKASARYPALIEEAAREIEQLFPPSLDARRTRALLWLSGDAALIQQLSARLDSETVRSVKRVTEHAQAQSAGPLGLAIGRARLREAQRLVDRCLVVGARERRAWMERLGAWSMHPVWGLPILAGVLVVMYWLVGDVAAQRGVKLLEEQLFGRLVIPALTRLVHWAVPWAWFRALFVGEYGLLTMALPYALAIILPIVGMFFLCFGFLEDVGYLPRLAMMANRFCRLLGLNGKAVLPLMLGLGCGSMATMTARILDSRRDRVLVTLLLALGIPCSAQLGVLMAMLASQPPLAFGIWFVVLAAVVVIVGQIASRLLPGAESPFLYEIPPLRWPQLSNIVVKTLGRVEWYLKEAVPLFFLGTLALFLLDRAGFLHGLERLCEPVVVQWLGLPAKTTDAFLIGFLRRDFGAAGLYALQRQGLLSGVQVVVSLVTITLFVPCIAQYFMMMKERGWKIANAIAGVSFGIALAVGGLLFRVLTALHVRL